MPTPVSLELAGALIKRLALQREALKLAIAKAIATEQEERRQRIALEGRVALLHAETENLREQVAGWQRAHADLLLDWMQCEARRIDDVAEHTRPDSMPRAQMTTQQKDGVL